MLESIHPNTEERLQVADNDFEEEMTWEQAIEACKNLGDGWRLPTISELEIMYKKLHKKGSGNFKDDWYWSSMEDGTSFAWDFFFNKYGLAHSSCGYKTNTGYVRAVMTIELNNNLTI